MARIMIIDDDVELAENLSIFLKDAGYTTQILNDTKGATEKLIEETPDLLVLDVMFPEDQAAGFDLARKIRHTNEISSLPIILQTGVNQHFPMDFSEKDIDKKWMPVQKFVEKPIDMQKLLKKVQELLSVSGG